MKRHVINVEDINPENVVFSDPPYPYIWCHDFYEHWGHKGDKFFKLISG